MKRRIKVEDEVIVISGSGRYACEDETSGEKIFHKVLGVNYKKQQVVIAGVNVRRVTVRATTPGAQRSSVEKECPIHLSNVMRKDEWLARQAKA